MKTYTLKTTDAGEELTRVVAWTWAEALPMLLTRLADQATAEGAKHAHLCVIAEWKNGDYVIDVESK